MKLSKWNVAMVGEDIKPYIALEVIAEMIKDEKDFITYLWLKESLKEILERILEDITKEVLRKTILEDNYCFTWFISTEELEKCIKKAARTPH